MQTYIKKDVVERVADHAGMRQVDVSPVVDALFHVLREMMCCPGPECRIEIRDFGVFEVKATRAKTKARNPRTNELIFVPAHRKTHFRPGKRMKEALRLLGAGEPAPHPGSVADPEPRGVGTGAEPAEAVC